ncbi:Uncharacterised protein [Actinobacillus pleuropneumoniae]|nr:Uncharacterised protein [Actinobacillus pleuropneumoniae]
MVFVIIGNHFGNIPEFGAYQGFMRNRIFAAERFNDDVGDIIFGKGQVRQKINNRRLLNVVALLGLQIGLHTGMPDEKQRDILHVLDHRIQVSFQLSERIHPRNFGLLFRQAFGYVKRENTQKQQRHQRSDNDKQRQFML